MLYFKYTVLYTFQQFADNAVSNLFQPTGKQSKFVVNSDAYRSTLIFMIIVMSEPTTRTLLRSVVEHFVVQQFRLN